MKKRNLIIGSILAGTIGIAGLAQACGGPGEGFRGAHKGHGGDRMMHVMKKLDLSDEQRDAVRTIKRDSRNQMQAKRDEMQDIRQALRKQANAEAYDAAKVRELADAKAKIMADITVQRIETMQKVRKQLSAEQLAKFDDMKDRRSMRGDF